MGVIMVLAFAQHTCFTSRSGSALGISKVMAQMQWPLVDIGLNCVGAMA